MEKKLKILIVESRFYSEISDQLLLGAKKELESENISFEIVSVPGALEIAQAMNIIISNNVNSSKQVGYDGFIALGCVIRGETSHYDYVCSESIRWLNYLSIKNNLCLGNGILTCENIEQANNRAHVDKGNKGGSAAKATLALVKIKKTYRIR
tara:strand:- start:141 stop:599 length:459 start_codon:yes stop_codon:yes gene_type:complete